MKGFYTILLLIVSNVFMTFAWYGHLKMKQEYSWFAALPLIGVITFSWVIAFFEYSCQIPANRIGFVGNGGPFSLMQLKVIQEVITLIIFTVFTTVFFKGETLHWNQTEASFGFNRGAVLYKRRLYSYEMEPPFICLFAKPFFIWHQAYIVSCHPYSKS